MTKVTIEDFYIGEKHYDKQEFDFYDHNQLSDIIKLLFDDGVSFMQRCYNGKPLNFFIASKHAK